MKLKELGSIRHTVIGFALIILCFVAASIADAAPIDAVQDTRQPDTLCKDGLMAVGECPDGYEFVPQGLIFSENFDDQPDWFPTGSDCGRVSPEKCNAGVSDVPDGWSYYRHSDGWNPSTGDNDKEYGMRISSEVARGGSGKSWIKSSESSRPVGEANYYSDSILMKEFDGDYDELYVEFYVRFDPSWFWASGSPELKMFRMGHIDDGNIEIWQLGSTGFTAPMYLYQLKNSSTWGMRAHHEPRCDAQNPNYFCGDNDGQDPLYECDIGTTCTGIGTVNGGQPFNDPTFTELFGDGAWVKMAYYIKLNTALGASNGIYRHYINDVLQHEKTDIQWRYSDSDLNVKINFFSIGGNWRNFTTDGIANKTEQEYAIDDVRVCNSELCL